MERRSPSEGLMKPLMKQQSDSVRHIGLVTYVCAGVGVGERDRVWYSCFNLATDGDTKA